MASAEQRLKRCLRVRLVSLHQGCGLHEALGQARAPVRTLFNSLVISVAVICEATTPAPDQVAGFMTFSWLAR